MNNKYNIDISYDNKLQITIHSRNEFIYFLKYNIFWCKYGLNCKYKNCNLIHFSKKLLCNNCNNKDCKKIHIKKCKYENEKKYCNNKKCTFLHEIDKKNWF